jgi:Ni,Fe-hydrogenase I cytochrome b subunit
MNKLITITLAFSFSIGLLFLLKKVATHFQHKKELEYSEFLKNNPPDHWKKNTIRILASYNRVLKWFILLFIVGGIYFIIRTILNI